MRNWQRRMARLLGAGLLGWAACAAADEPVRETRNISQPFSEVRLVGDFDLELTQSDTVSLVIEAAREDLPHLRSEVSDGVLTLTRTDAGPLNFLSSRHWAAHAFLSTKAIDRLVVGGSGDIHAGAWTSHALTVRVSGAGDVKLDQLTAAHLTCDLAGSGDVLIAGSVTSQRIRISGSGQYKAPDLKSQRASVSISGSGEVEVWVERALEVRIAGSGDVGYYGTPTVTQSVPGSGHVRSLGAKNAP